MQCGVNIWSNSCRDGLWYETGLWNYKPVYNLL